MRHFRIRETVYWLDVFAPYLITLNYPAAKLIWRARPRCPTSREALCRGPLCGSRYAGTPVYHRLQYLLCL